MGRTRRHHTVPAFYLRRFANEKERLERLEVASGTRQVISVKNASVETDFYTVVTDDGPSEVIERRLSEIESMAATALQHLDSGLEPTSNDISGLCNFIAIQMTRGRDFRDKLDGFAEQIMKRMMLLEAGLGLGRDRVAQIIEQATGEKPGDEDVTKAMEWMRSGDISMRLHPNASIRAMLEGAAPLVEMFAEMKWKVATFSDPVLITSDSLVSMWVEDPHLFWGVGVATADQISLPVSSSKAFVIYPHANSDSVLEPPSAGDLNRRTMSSAHRWLFMDPGWMERTQRLLDHKMKTPVEGFERVRAAAAALLSASFEVLKGQRVIPLPKFHPYLRVGRDYYGPDLMWLDEFKEFERILTETYPERFDRPISDRSLDFPNAYGFSLIEACITRATIGDEPFEPTSPSAEACIAELLDALGASDCEVACKHVLQSFWGP